MKKQMKKLLTIALAVLILFVSIFTNSVNTYAAPKSGSKKVTKIALNSTRETTAVGCSLILKVKSAAPAGASKKVTWSSSDNKIATVSKKGVVKAKKTGIVTITAKSTVNKKAVAKCKIKVYKATKKLKLISNKSYNLEQGKSVTLKAKVTKPAKGYEPVKWSSKNPKVAKVNKKGKVTAVSEGKTTVTGQSGNKKVKVTIVVREGDASQTPDMPTPDNPSQNDPSDNPSKEDPENPDDIVPDGPQTSYTRAEWTAILADKMGYGITEENLPKDPETGAAIYSYEDISAHACALQIEAALQNGIIPFEADAQEALFCPDDYVTREFAAVTTMRALGFAEDGGIDSSDAAAVNYPAEAKMAVDKGMFVLKDGAFCPDDLVSEDEFAALLQLIDTTLSGRQIDPDHVDTWEYTDAVVVVDDEAGDYAVSGQDGKLCVTVSGGDIAEDIGQGQILMLPANEEFPEGLPFKVEEVSADADGNKVYLGGLPESFEEVFESVDIEGIGQIDVDHIVLAEGVEPVEDISEESDLSADRLNKDETLEESISKSFKINLIPGLNPTVTLKIDNVHFKLNYNDNKVNELLIEIPNEISLKSECSSKWSGSKEIAKIPAKLPAGFSINVVLSLTAGIDGKMSLEYKLENTLGVQYTENSGLQVFKSMNPNAEFKAEANAKAGIKFKIEITWAEVAREIIADVTGKKGVAIPIYNVGTEAGVGISASVRTNLKLTCTDAALYLYWDIFVGDGDTVLTKILPVLGHRWKIFDKGNSPLKTSLHFENGSRVSKCTYKEGTSDEENTGGNTGGTTGGDDFEEGTVPILYSGTWHGMNWSIDENGKLLVDGKDSREAGSSALSDKPGWCSYDKEIKTAVIKVEGLKSAIYMFYNCNNLTSVDLSRLDTSSVMSAIEMFSGCSSLRSVDLSGLDTSNVKSMYRMFSGCSSLVSLDLSNFDTSSVTGINMKGMFSGCSSLSSLDLSNFDTSSVTNMNFMFYDCNSLRSVDLSSFDTSSVTDMSYMFYDCNSLRSVDLSSFDTSSVTDMSCMFSDCSSLNSVDFRGLNLRNVTNLSCMFSGCKQSDLKVSLSDTSGLTTTDCMFSGCAVTNLDLSDFDTSSVKDMKGMFSNCSIVSVDISGFETSNVKDMSYMFAGCSSLISLVLSGFNTGNVTDMYRMFSSCSSLVSVDISGFETSNVKNMDYMFSGCSSLISLDLSSFNARRVTYANRMFSGCSSLSSIRVPFNTSVTVDLPAKFYDAAGRSYEYLPQAVTVSFEITRKDL